MSRSSKGFSLCFCSGLLAVLLVAGCKKDGCFKGLKITANKSVLFLYDSLVMRANVTGLSHYDWTGPNNFEWHATNGLNFVKIQHIRLKQAGWFYCTASVEGCKAYTDSIYIDVKYNQWSPICGSPDNWITPSMNLPETQAKSVTRRFDASLGSIVVSVKGREGDPSYEFTFHPYYGNREPQDGAYGPAGFNGIDPLDDLNVIDMRCTYGTSHFTTSDFGNIYVSHVNGKLRLLFCSIHGMDERGANTKFTGQVTED